MQKKTTKAKKITNPIKKLEFYTKTLDEAEKMDFENASNIEGVDAEIAILRVKIKELLEKTPNNVMLIVAATAMLSRLVRVRYNMTKNQDNGLKKAIGNVLKKYAAPLAAALISKKL